MRFLIVVCIFASALCIQAEPNLSGVWQLNKEKTEFKRKPPESMRWKIDQEGPNVVVTLRVNADGVQQQFAFRYAVGGDTRNEIHGAPMNSHAEWDADAFVTRSVAVIGGKELRMSDRFTLSSDGQTLTLRQKHQYGTEPEGEDVVIADRRAGSSWEPDAPPKKAAEVYKNIQIMKDTPAPQLMRAMNFFTQWLGVRCDHCHVAGAFEKDDKPAKATARSMLNMVSKINADNFGGKNPVTCWTCHRGQTKPQSLPPQ